MSCQGSCCQTASYRPAFPEFGHPGCPVETCQACVVAEAETLPPRGFDPNEYVYDGGDRDPQARLREDLSVVGLDPEDTLIRFETQSGSVELQSGCRVPIYAPRFAATRKITGLGYQERVIATQAAIREQRTGRMQDAIPPTDVRRRLEASNEENVHVVEALRDRQRGLRFDKVLPAIDISDAFKPYEDLAIIREGKLISDDQIKFRRAALAAMSWSNVEDLEVIVDNVATQLVEESRGPEEIYVYELDGKPRVRLCKVASHQVAEPGDVIDFTIRFDNVGDQSIKNIVIHDSLSRRLEYVDSSQKSSLPSQFESTANDEGSSILTWTVESELAPGEGGFIRFQCRVR